MSEAQAPAAAPVAASTPTTSSEAVESESDGIEESTPQAAAPKAEPARNYKLKVDGQEVNLTEEEMIKHASLGKAAQKRMEEAAVIRKENDAMKKDIETFFNLLKENPLAILEDESLGLNTKQIAELLMNKELEKAKKSPEQVEKEKLQAQLQKAQKQLKEAEEAKQKEEWEKLQNEAAANIEREIMDALETKELPKSPYVINRMVSALHLAAQNKISLSAKEVLPIVKKWIVDDMKGISGLLPEEQLESILGEEKISSLRKRYIQRVKTATSAKDVKSTGGDVKSAQQKKNSGKSAVNAKDFFKKLGSL